MTDALQPYTVVFSSRARKQLPDELPEAVAAAVIELVYEGVARAPHRVRKALRPPLDGVFKVNRGTFRVLYQVYEEERSVQIMTIQHRRDVYRT